VPTALVVFANIAWTSLFATVTWQRYRKLTITR
jgi:hypothetical protein